MKGKSKVKNCLTRKRILQPMTCWTAHRVHDAQTPRPKTLLTFDFCLLTFDLPFPLPFLCLKP